MSDIPISETGMEECERPQKKAKQVNIIRKTTVEALHPIIAKVEEHIEYLLQQSTKLRLKSETLERTVADHAVLSSSIQDALNQIHQLREAGDLTASSISNDKLLTRRDITNITTSIDEVSLDLRKKQARLTELEAKTVEQGGRLDSTKESLEELLEKYSERVEDVQAQNKKLALQLRSNYDLSTAKIQSLEQKIRDKEEKYAETDKKIELYLAERAEMRQSLLQISQKMDKVVMVDQYESDWRVIRMENQQMRKDNQKMIDQALTPEVRAFLPEMLQRMAEIRKVNALETYVYQQKALGDELQKRHEETFQKLYQQLQEAEQSIITLDAKREQQSKEMFEQLSQKMETGSSTQTDTISALKTETVDLIQGIEQELRGELSNVVETNKDKIYSVVYELVPQEEKDFFAKMKEFLPLLEKTKTEVMQRCDQINEFGEKLEGRLDEFHNKVVKVKSDVGIVFDSLNKKNRQFDDNFTLIRKEFSDVGKLMSMFCETLMLSYSLSIDLVDSEVFVTYSDGIIYENNPDDDNQVLYRKVRAPKELLTRAALTTMVKLTDQLITSDQYSFLKVSLNKPSDCFKLIKDCINYKVLGAKTHERKGTQRGESLLSNKKHQRNQSRERRLPSLEMNPSKTIDVTSPPLESNPRGEMISQILTTTDFKTSVRRPDRGYKNRYSQMS